MKVFVSYRRSDSSYVADRIYEYLLRYYDNKDVFRDIDSISPGTDFRVQLDAAIEQCGAVLAVIGSRWVTVPNEAGVRRLEDPKDYVRMEIEVALQRRIPLIPLLIEETSVPSKDDLPQTIAELASRQGIPVRRDPDFFHDMERVVDSLRQHGFSNPQVDNDDNLHFGDLGL